MNSDNCAASDLIPGLVEHDRATYWYTGLVLHERCKGAVVIFRPMCEERACAEKGFGKGLEGVGWKLGCVLFPDEVLVVPVTAVSTISSLQMEGD